MAIRECKRGHLVRDDEADFCPTCRVEGATVLLGPPAGNRPVASARTSTNVSERDPASATVGMLFIAGVLGQLFGWFIVSASTEDAGDWLGFAVIAAGGTAFTIAVIAVGVSLGIRVARGS